MLLFIHLEHTISISSSKISIHLMLLFIWYCLYSSSNDCYFNTSHVTVYPHERRRILCLYIISIHLMLLFIGSDGVKSNEITVFQYISCYCLSAPDASNASSNVNFNTSHVTVYQREEGKHHNKDRFQYISCYCLSYSE